MQAKIITMFEWKVFESRKQTTESLNCLMDRLAHDGWEIMQVDFDLHTALARKAKTLLD